MIARNWSTLETKDHKYLTDRGVRYVLSISRAISNRSNPVLANAPSSYCRYKGCIIQFSSSGQFQHTTSMDGYLLMRVGDFCISTVL